MSVNNKNKMNAILIKIIIALYSFIVANPQIPQDVKEQALKVVTDNATEINGGQTTPISQPTQATNTSGSVVQSSVINDAQVNGHITVVMDGTIGDSFTINKGEKKMLAVFVFGSLKNINPLRDKTLKIETTDPLGFSRIGGYSGDQSATVTSQEVNGTGDMTSMAGIKGFYYPIGYDNQTVGAQTFTLSVPSMGVSKTITVNVQ